MRIVTNTEELQAAFAEGLDPHDIDIVAAPPEVLAQARQEGFERGRREVMEEAIQEERARIVKIKSLAPAKHEELVATAISSGMDPATFALMVLREDKQSVLNG